MKHMLEDKVTKNTAELSKKMRAQQHQQVHHSNNERKLPKNCAKQPPELKKELKNQNMQNLKSLE